MTNDPKKWQCKQIKFSIWDQFLVFAICQILLCLLHIGNFNFYIAIFVINHKICSLHHDCQQHITGGLILLHRYPINTKSYCFATFARKLQSKRTYSVSIVTFWFYSTKVGSTCILFLLYFIHVEYKK